MFQLKQRYEKIVEKQPYLSSYMTFAETVRNTGITENTIRRWFYKLVDPEDYAKDEVRAVLRHLVALAEPRKV